jgi:hypothetical protein
VAILSTEVRKFFKFPVSARPLGPIKTAKTLEVITPMAIFRITLTLFKEATLNSGVRFMVVKKLNGCKFENRLQNYYYLAKKDGTSKAKSTKSLIPYFYKLIFIILVTNLYRGDYQ